MSEIGRAALFSKLNSLAYKAIESATVFCKLRGNPYVELVHWLHQILQLQNSDLHRIIAAYELNPARLAKDMTEALDRLPRGAASISDLSAHVEEAVERGWVYSTLMFRDSQVRTGHLVVGILKTPGLRNTLPAISREFEKVKVDDLCERFGGIVGGSPEDALRRYRRQPVPPPRGRRAMQWRPHRWVSRKRCAGSPSISRSGRPRESSIPWSDETTRFVRLSIS